MTGGFLAGPESFSISAKVTKREIAISTETRHAIK